MKNNQRDIWLTNSKIFSEIQRSVPRISDIDTDRFIQYTLLQNSYTHNNGQTYTTPSNVNLIYWADEKFGLEKCIFNVESKESIFENFKTFPHKKDYTLDSLKNYGPPFCAGTFAGSYGLIFGAFANKLNETSPYILSAVLFTLVFILMGTTHNNKDKKLTDSLKKQEILADWQAWKSYRTSTFGKRI